MDEANEIVEALILDLRMIAGSSGMVEFLERLKSINVYALQPLIAQSQPMFFKDAWDELFDAILKEATGP